MKELHTFKQFLNEREVTVTDEHKAEMLRVAQDLHNIVKTHDGVEGTRLLNAKMQQRDALKHAARTLEFLVSSLK
tara:strand:- start:127 stop:351 length:225 start_codon:yes stop_codon:yes gene_type:complete